MKPKQQHNREIIQFSTIRVEKELSKFPVHNLAKRGTLKIDIRGKDKTGKEFRWQVSPSRNHGEPRELAYKIDTLVINRRIETAGRVKPKIIKLGSLRSICRELGLNEGKAVNDVKKALRQNAHAGITAKITYQTIDGVEQILEGDFTRYSIIFTGERFPDGRKADAVYIVLNDIYKEVINSAGTRPLDYDYLKQLPPASQRFYELVSPQIFAAIKHHRSVAKYKYSDFCTHSALTRYYEARQAKKQINNILKPHKNSGYINKVMLEETMDDGYKPDWLIILTPGAKAHVEFQQFTSKHELVKDLDDNRESQSTLLDFSLNLMQQEPSREPAKELSATEPLSEQLVKLGMNKSAAQELAEKYTEPSRLWIDVAKQGCLPKTVRNIGAYLLKAITQSYAPPQTYQTLKPKAVINQDTAKNTITRKPRTLKQQIAISSQEETKFDQVQFEAACKKLGVDATKWRVVTRR